MMIQLWKHNTNDSEFEIISMLIQGIFNLSWLFNELKPKNHVINCKKRSKFTEHKKYQKNFVSSCVIGNFIFGFL